MLGRGRRERDCWRCSREGSNTIVAITVTGAGDCTGRKLAGRSWSTYRCQAGDAVVTAKASKGSRLVLVLKRSGCCVRLELSGKVVHGELAWT